MRRLGFLAFFGCWTPSAIASPEVVRWTESGNLSQPARQLLQVMSAAETYGLRSGDYVTLMLLDDMLKLSRLKADAAVQRGLETELSAAATRFVSDLHYGRVNPRAAGFELMRPRIDLDVAVEVAAIARVACHTQLSVRMFGATYYRAP
jgi:hypothetical protein